MAHDLDITDGQASFVSAREDAWHHLGTVLPDSFTAEEAMAHGHLGGWNVRKTPLYTSATDDKADLIEVPGRYAVVRDNPIVKGQVDPLGVVGPAYHVIQNEDHAEFLNALVEQSGARFETAGAIDGGRRVFITMKLPGPFKVGGVDPIDMYIAAVNSHDGSSSFTIMRTPVRIVCANTLNVAIGGMSQYLKVRHTRGYRQAVGEAQKVLDLSLEYFGELQTRARRMANTPLSVGQFEQIIQKTWGIDEANSSKAAVTRNETKMDEMTRLFTEAYTQEGIRDTVWAGFNAVAEWADHFQPVRGEDREERRAVKALLDPGFKDWAFKVFYDLAA